MKPYKILNDFTGSQTGTDGPHYFKAGTVAELSNSLAETVLKEGWAEPHVPEKQEAAPARADQRDTKVTGPDETKPFDITTLDEKGLVKFAKDNFGLKLNAKVGKDALLKAIEEHAADKAAA